MDDVADDLDRALEIQRARFPHPIGFKVALTSQEAQAALGVRHPLYGRIQQEHVLEAPTALPAVADGTRLELEVAIHLDERGELRARLAFEVLRPFHRREGLPTVAADLVADNVILSAAVLGDPLPSGEDELSGLLATLEVDGDVVAAGSFGDVQGGPLASHRWFLDEADRRGEQLGGSAVRDAPHLVLTGSAIPAFDVESGHTYRGSVSANGVPIGSVVMTTD